MYLQQGQRHAAALGFDHAFLNGPAGKKHALGVGCRMDPLPLPWRHYVVEVGEIYGRYLLYIHANFTYLGKRTYYDIARMGKVKIYGFADIGAVKLVVIQLLQTIRPKPCRHQYIPYQQFAKKVPQPVFPLYKAPVLLLHGCWQQGQPFLPLPRCICIAYLGIGNLYQCLLYISVAAIPPIHGWFVWPLPWWPSFPWDRY